MNTDKPDDLVIWGAVGPNGQLVKSSVGTFKSVAARWALRRGNYDVVKLGTIPSPGKLEEEEEAPKVKAKASPEKEKVRREPKVKAIPSHRRREPPAESDMELSSSDTPSTPPAEDIEVPEKYKIDRDFFGRRRKRRK